MRNYYLSYSWQYTYHCLNIIKIGNASYALINNHLEEHTAEEYNNSKSEYLILMPLESIPLVHYFAGRLKRQGTPVYLNNQNNSHFEYKREGALWFLTIYRIASPFYCAKGFITYSRRYGSEKRAHLAHPTALAASAWTWWARTFIYLTYRARCPVPACLPSVVFRSSDSETG